MSFIPTLYTRYCYNDLVDHIRILIFFFQTLRQTAGQKTEPAHVESVHTISEQRRLRLAYPFSLVKVFPVCTHRLQSGSTEWMHTGLCAELGGAKLSNFSKRGANLKKILILRPKLGM